MLITKHFAFVHVKKTGGRFIRNLCQHHMPRDWIVSVDLNDHAAAREIPEEYRDLPVLAYVRNPWDWYVSWYHYLPTQPERFDSPYWTDVFDEGKASFEEVVRVACTGVPAPHRNSPRWMDRMRESGTDLFSIWCSQLFRDGFEGTVDVRRFERLREEFIDFLDTHRVPVDDDFAGHVMERAPDNVGDRDEYTKYYTPELRDLVGDKSEVVREYGYTFGD
jgi:hypothetical protein